jgi:hypothetical protein
MVGKMGLKDRKRGILKKHGKWITELEFFERNDVIWNASSYLPFDINLYSKNTVEVITHGL